MPLSPWIFGSIAMVMMAAPASETTEVDELVPVVLHIDVSALKVAQEEYWVNHTHEIAKRYIPPMFESRGITVLDQPSGDTATVTITLSWINYQDSIYATDIIVTRPGQPDRKLERIVCDPCIDHMVMDKIEPNIDEIVPWLEVDMPTDPNVPAESTVLPPLADSPESVPGPTATSTAPDPAAGDGVHPRRGGLGPLGWAGIATTGVGAVALLSGGLVFARGDDDVRILPWRHEYRDYRPAGIATMAVGGACLGAGLAMLGTRLVLRRRERSEQTTAGVSLGRHLGVFTVTHRF